MGHPLYQRMLTAQNLEALDKGAAEDRSYHDAKHGHYLALASAARSHGSIAECVALERMADRHRILARG